MRHRAAARSGDLARGAAVVASARVRDLARGNRAKAELWAKKALREDPAFSDA
jgi:hypothetical protein